MMFPLQDTVEWRFPFESSRCHLSLLLSWRQQMCRWTLSCVGLVCWRVWLCSRCMEPSTFAKKNLYSFKMDVLQTVSRVKHNRGTCYSYCYGWIGDSILRVCVLFIHNTWTPPLVYDLSSKTCSLWDLGFYALGILVFWKASCVHWHYRAPAESVHCVLAVSIVIFLN